MRRQKERKRDRERTLQRHTHRDHPVAGYADGRLKAKGKAGVRHSARLPVPTPTCRSCWCHQSFRWTTPGTTCACRTASHRRSAAPQYSRIRSMQCIVAGRSQQHRLADSSKRVREDPVKCGRPCMRPATSTPAAGQPRHPATLQTPLPNLANLPSFEQHLLTWLT